MSVASTRRKPKDPKGPHVRVYHDLLKSPAYVALSPAAKALFMDLRLLLNGSNNGNISATFGRLKGRGWKSKTTFSNALFELQVLGFIEKTRGGGVRYGSKVCCLYRFTDLECYEFQNLGIPHKAPTDDYKKFANLEEANRALQDALDKKAEENAKNNISRRAVENAECKKRTVQNMDCDGPETGLIHLSDGPETGQEALATVQNLDQKNGRGDGRKPQALYAIQPIEVPESAKPCTSPETGHLYKLPPQRVKNRGRIAGEVASKASSGRGDGGCSHWRSTNG